MNIETFQKIIVDFQKRELPKLTEREMKISFVNDMSLAIIGARRSGKTYRTYQFIQNLMEQGINKKNICRIQFNDHRLKTLTIDKLHLIDEAFYTLYPEKLEKEVIYFIFDEIHRIDGWEDYILYLLENNKHKILITGSSSKFLKGEIATGLRGKNFSLKIFPFSFREFIKHYNIKNDIYSTKGQIYLRKIFNKFLNQGGFPGLLNTDKNLHIELLQNYWDTMVFRDIIEAHPQSNINIITFSYFAQSVLSRISCPMTIRKIIKNLENKEMKFTSETIYKYLQYLEDAFMLYSIPIYSKSEKIRNRNYRKVYAIDWALANAIAPIEGIDVTRKFENLIFIELLRRGNEIAYYRTTKGYEIDFITTSKKEHTSEKSLYQVCYQFDNEDVRNRELRGIKETAEYLKIKKCFIITYNNEEIITIDKILIKVIPAWKWLLF